jgi:hypothetical protein
LRNADVRGCNLPSDDKLLELFRRKKLIIQELLKPNSKLLEKSPWKVLLTNEFVTALRQDSSLARDDVVHVLLKLASGNWNKKVDSTLNFVSPRHAPTIRVAIVEGELKFVWTVDVDGKQKEQAYQVLKIWGIVRKEPDLRRVVDRAENALKVYSDEYLKRCFAVRVGDSTRPLKYFHDQSFVWNDDKYLEKAQQDCEVSTAVQSSKMFEFNSLNISLLLKSQNTFELPFKMSDEEEDIVCNQMSSL